MEKITYSEFCKKMWDFNQEHDNGEDGGASITGVIVYKQSNFDKPYTVEQRSYRVSNHNRCFQAGKIANSMFGSCLDGTEHGVRLDWYRWEPEYCYID